MKNFKSSYLLLATGGLFMLFSNGRWIIPFAAWIFPVFFIHYMRMNTSRKSLLGVALVSAFVNPIMYYGTMPLPKPVYFIITVFVMQIMTMCFWMYRKLVIRDRSFLATLYFPSLWVATEFITSLFPKATWNVLAYTQTQNLSLAQLASVTGIWGISFLVTWFAALVEWAWSHDFKWELIRRGAITFASIFGFIYLMGFARVNFFSSGSNTVKVASILQARKANQSLNLCKWTDARAIGNYSQDVEKNLLEKTKQAAEAGAKFILWQESAGFIPRKEEEEFVRQASVLAANQKINLMMTLWSVPTEYPHQLVENKLVLIDSNGSIHFTYLKSHPAPPEPIVKGQPTIPVFNSGEARIAAAICFDGDFPSFIRQAGKRDIDIFFLPANDWKQITKVHADMAIMRAIENGFSLVRAAGQGISTMNDSRGRTLAMLDFYGTDDQVIIADVPARRSFTLYPVLGDWFAWCCVGFVTIHLLRAIQNGFAFKKSKWERPAFFPELKT